MVKAVSNEYDRFAFVSITWNKHRWTEIDRESDSNHKYIMDGNRGHEHLNFKFDKKGIDGEEFAYGYAPAFRKKRKLRTDGTAVLFFVSSSGNGVKIVGVYGGAGQVDERQYEFKGYEEEGGLALNLRCTKDLSAHFAHYLDIGRYNSGKTNIGRAGIKYIREDTAKRIILDEIAEYNRQGQSAPKLSLVFEAVAGHGIEDEWQEDAEAAVREMPEDEMERVLRQPGPRYVEYRGRMLSRDAVSIEIIKERRGHECQICHSGVRRKDGTLYVEGAHITPKSESGSEAPDNILVLCPNHHKEFDIGDRKITRRTGSKIAFTLNEKRYEIGLG